MLCRHQPLRGGGSFTIAEAARPQPGRQPVPSGYAGDGVALVPSNRNTTTPHWKGIAGADRLPCLKTTTVSDECTISVYAATAAGRHG